ncbi:hypothetical protein PRUPE_2G249700 [Prunus persica]|uniref:Uncharacterized protein n=2 Tax=Prunus persica TaxID=3760 RepID=A0A251QLD3_PRUPE|nr:hypothetical protein PRUPE_2G249700 [Prunus persica]
MYVLLIGYLWVLSLFLSSLYPILGQRKKENNYICFFYEINKESVLEKAGSIVRRVGSFLKMASYYDIDDILVEEQRVPVVFQQAVNGVDIDPSAETHCVEPGSKVELPYWLAHELHLRKVAKMKVPACFNQRTKLELGADGASVDLRSRCLYFYEFGCKIAPLVGDRDMGSFLLSAFRTRYQKIVAKAHNAAFTAHSKLLSYLTKEETNLYEAAQSSMAAFKKWRIGGPRFERASVLGRKRKEAN